MPILDRSSGSDGAYAQPISQGGMGQVVAPEIPTPVPATLAPSGSWNSGLILSDGLRWISVGATLSQSGTLSVTRYIDIAGNVGRAAVTSALVANTPLILDVADLLPCVSFQISITNGSASTSATISEFAVLLSGG